MKITRAELKEMIRVELNEVGDPYDGVYNNLHDAMVAVHNVFKKQKVDRKTMGAFRKWWDQLDRFYPRSSE